MRTYLPGLVLLTLAADVSAEPFELRDGDRVVWIGGTVIEREQKYGTWEAALTRSWPEHNVTFRNLGWSGDTVWGESRASFDFDKPGEGYRRLVAHTLALKPTVVFVGYGTNESFAGADGLPRFRQQYEKLIDDLSAARPRFVLLAPPRFEQTSWKAGEFERHREDLQLYTEAIRETALKHGAWFVDDIAQKYAPAQPLTDNGMHLTERGYAWTANNLLRELRLPVRDSRLSPKQAEKLRQAIVEKNQLYFHRWRPQNETYLFGFRRHEQGQNAREIPQFDPLVAKLEAEIARLRKPVTHRYELVPQTEK